MASLPNSGSAKRKEKHGDRQGPQTVGAGELVWIRFAKLPLTQKWLEKMWQDLVREIASSPRASVKFRSQLSKNLVVVIVGTKKARALNRQFRGRDYATDILSFEGAGDTLGELVFCDSKIRAQAKANRHSVRAEMAYLLIHGVLHLLGFEHEGSGRVAERKAQLMLHFQDLLFDRIREKYDL